MSGPAGILLAAGKSTRFGANKLLVDLSEEGTPMAVSAARTLRAALARSVAVVQADDVRLASLMADTGLEVVRCANAARGMGTSLACAVAALRDADGWVVALADMPRVRRETIAAVADALRDGAAIAVPRFEGKRGHPVGFSREFGEALQALDGDIGGRDIIAANESRVAWLDVDDPGIVQDVDRATDIAALTR